MNALVAFAHIVGACVVVMVASIFGYILDERARKRRTRTLFETLAVEGVISATQAQAEIHYLKAGWGREPLDTTAIDAIVQWSSRRYSSELLRNRISDFSDIVESTCRLFFVIGELAILGVVIYSTVVVSTANAVWAWLIVPTWFASVVSMVAFEWLCKLLTGRLPGEARGARKALSRIVLARATEGVI